MSPHPSVPAAVPTSVTSFQSNTFIYPRRVRAFFCDSDGYPGTSMLATNKWRLPQSTALKIADPSDQLAFVFSNPLDDGSPFSPVVVHCHLRNRRR